MSLLFAALLGIIQGLTEFLPVSSSAHLILARAFFGWDAEEFGIAFDVACHVGTLVAVVAYFWADILAMVRALPRLLTLRQPLADPKARLMVLIAVGTVPAVVIGLLFGKVLEEQLRTPAVAAVTLAVVRRLPSSPWSDSVPSAAMVSRSTCRTRSSSAGLRPPR